MLSSPESATLLERALQAVGGVRTGGPPKLDPVTAAVQKHKVRSQTVIVCFCWCCTVEWASEGFVLVLVGYVGGAGCMAMQGMMRAVGVTLHT